jgi:hypothetical protein
MKYYFTEEFDIREWKRWEVEAESFGEACRKYAQRREDGEPGEVVASEIIPGGGLIEVRDEKEHGEPDQSEYFTVNRTRDLRWDRNDILACQFGASG